MSFASTFRPTQKSWDGFELARTRMKAAVDRTWGVTGRGQDAEASKALPHFKLAVAGAKATHASRASSTEADLVTGLSVRR